MSLEEERARFEVRDRCELFRWVDQTLRREKYWELKRMRRRPMEFPAESRVLPQTALAT